MWLRASIAILFSFFVVRSHAIDEIAAQNNSK